MKAIVSDGIIWGVGATEELALADVRESNITETAEAVLADHAVVEISEEQARAVVENGDTAYNG